MSAPCILAPLSGISDLPFRMINRRMGCELAFVEMISAHALVYQNRKTLGMLSTTPADRPLGVQLIGNEPETLRRALDILEKYRFDIIDFNAACPVKKVTSKGEGADLMREPRKLAGLLRVIADNAEVPVTVKIRSGWDAKSVNARDIALYAEDAGLSAVFIHGRTKVQGYSGRVNYQVIKEVKKAVGIPVIGSGDAFSPQLIKKMFDETGCDGVTIARGSLGNPWIFNETSVFLGSGRLPERPGSDAIAWTMTEHFNLCIDFYGEAHGTMVFRKFFAWYTKGLSNMKPIRDKAFRADTKEQMEALIKEVNSTCRDIQRQRLHCH